MCIISDNYKLVFASVRLANLTEAKPWDNEQIQKQDCNDIHGLSGHSYCQTVIHTETRQYNIKSGDDIHKDPEQRYSPCRVEKRLGFQFRYSSPSRSKLTNADFAPYAYH